MSDARSPVDDSFADLFGSPPDPAVRDTAPGAAAPAAPSSRRAAREAAAQASGGHPPVAEPSEPVHPRPRHTPSVPAEPSLTDLFSGAATTDTLGHVPVKTSKRRKRRGRWIAFAVVLVVLGGIAGGGAFVWSVYGDKVRSVMGWQEPTDYAAGQAHGQALLTVVSGDTGASISRSLASAGVTKTSSAFYDLLVSTGQNPTFYPGVYKLQKEMSAKAVLAALKNPATRMDHSVLLREGITMDQTLTILSDTLKISLPELQAAVKDPTPYGVQAQSLEGWLFPALYTFEPGAKPTDIIRTLVNRTVQSLDKAKVPVADRQRILTIASIIQREARFTQDFYKVSRVIENRLDPNNQETFGKLQMDSTAQYGYGEMHDGTASSSAAALKDDNPWNTYVHPGLPIGPIANPGDLAIDAAMHPADGPWLYFVTVNMDTGETVFSTTYADQQKAVAQMQAWCSAHPNSGC